MNGGSLDELLIATLAGMLDGLSHVAVGAASPIPAAASLLARERSGGRLRVSILGSERHNPFTDGGKELFDCAAEGRIDAFFLGGGQIDGEANINLVGIGDYPKTSVRWPGSFGSAFLYFMVPKVILFRDTHSPRLFVPEGGLRQRTRHQPRERPSPGRPTRACNLESRHGLRSCEKTLSAEQPASGREPGWADRGHRLRVRP